MTARPAAFQRHARLVSGEKLSKYSKFRLRGPEYIAKVQTSSDDFLRKSLLCCSVSPSLRPPLKSFFCSYPFSLSLSLSLSLSQTVNHTATRSCVSPPPPPIPLKGKVQNLPKDCCTTHNTCVKLAEKSQINGIFLCYRHTLCTHTRGV